MAETFLVLGDQLSTDVDPWSTMPADTVVLIIESDHLIGAGRHLTRTALYLAAMRAFAQRVRDLGYEVDYRHARGFADGLEGHRARYRPARVVMNRPRGRRAAEMFRNLDVELLADPFYLSQPASVGETRAGQRKATMEQFYRSQRRTLGVLMEGDEPTGGRWNFDEDNRRPLPRGGGSWPEPWSRPADAAEQQVVDGLSGTHPGADALAWWPRTRQDALDQLADAVERIVPGFGPYEDAASSHNWHLAHTRLSVAMNLGLLHPGEVVAAVRDAFEAGRVPLASAEAVIRQVIGWREWVWSWHQAHDDRYRSSNHLGATEPLPESWRRMRPHGMACIDAVLGHLRDYGWTHHIERLMVLANAATLAGINPVELNDWMAENFVDGAEWVMEANVLGMGTYADGGQVSTKPYVAGGNYIHKMTDFCRGCRYSPNRRVGEQACPLTNGYWNFLLDHTGQLESNHRLAPQLRAAARLADRVEVQREKQLHRSRILGADTEG